MRIEHDGHLIVLSRRNLLTLLEKLDGHPPNSACTIMAPPQYGVWAVKAEEDGEHYLGSHRPATLRGMAGRMHPDTEQALVDDHCQRRGYGNERVGIADTVLDPRD